MDITKLAWALAVCLLPVPAVAQTAEEAVAYAFLGLADGATLSRGQTQMSWKEAGTSPATFEGEAVIGGKPARLRFIVTKVDECHYEVTLEGPANLVPGSTRLYAQVSLGEVDGLTVQSGGLKADVTGSGFCETGPVNRACMAMSNPDLFGAVDPARHKANVDYLKSEVCRKS
jgi:hypothetical protein